MSPKAVGAVQASVIVAIARALYSRPENGAQFVETAVNYLDEAAQASTGDILAALSTTREILMGAEI